MLAYPDTLPTDAIGVVVTFVRTKTPSAQLAQAAWCLAGYALGQVSPTPTTTFAPFAPRSNAPLPEGEATALCDQLEAAAQAQNTASPAGAQAGLMKNLPWGKILQLVLGVLSGLGA